MLFNILVMAASIILWAAKLLHDFRTRRIIIRNLTVLAGIILFWCLYLASVPSPFDPQDCGLAGSAICFYAGIYWRD